MKRTQNRICNFLCCFLLGVVSTFGQIQPLWEATPKEDLLLYQKNYRKVVPKQEKVFRLDLAALKSKLTNCQSRRERRLQFKNAPVLSFPNQKGVLVPYRIFQTAVLRPELQQKYPDIKSYIGKATDGSHARIYFSVSPLGVNGLVYLKTGKSYYLDPYTKDAQTYAIYSKEDLLHNGYTRECKLRNLERPSLQKKAKALRNTSFSMDGKLRTFRLALVCTGEYAQFHLQDQNIPNNATVAAKKEVVLAAMHATMTRVNALFERDVAVTMQLVDNETPLIFLDPVTDDLTNGNDIKMLGESQKICDSVIGNSNYDIGHVFSFGNSGIADLVSVCTSRKAQGVSGSEVPKGDGFDVDFVAHEMGHQFGATHTFNNSCEENREDNSAVEPGSGSTIMAYAGICSPNIQTNSDSYFHGVSIAQMYNQITLGTSTCAVQTDLGNLALTAAAGANYSIPKSTPFVLEGTASGLGENGTYSWEQTDIEDADMPPFATNTGGPLFRSLPPKEVPQRYFPASETVASGSLGSTWEQLPSVARTMDFKFTVRDNGLFGGQVASDGLTLSVDAESGPFKVTSQATATTFFAGASKQVTWDVANTDKLPVNTEKVTLLLSLDGGMSFPIVLASEVANDGTHAVVIPNHKTTQGRIKVAAVGNVFYSVNAADITIETSNFQMEFETTLQEVCQPDTAVYPFVYKAFFGFSETTQFSVEGLPNGVDAVFSVASARTDDIEVELNISGTNALTVGSYEFDLIGTSPSETKTVILTLEVYKNHVKSPKLVKPSNNTSDAISPLLLEWEGSSNVSYYELEIASDPTFANVLETVQTLKTSHVVQQLEEGTRYYWRVSANSPCQTGVYSEIFVFVMGNVGSFEFGANLEEESIPDAAPEGLRSVLSIPQKIRITDVDVILNIEHSYVGDLQITLTHPDGTEMLLIAADNQDTGSDFTETIFDDAAVFDLTNKEAPYTGRFRPEELLSVYNGKFSDGDWVLAVVDKSEEDEGVLRNWRLSIAGVAFTEIKVAPGFTPNGDGVNDTWIVQNIQDGRPETLSSPIARVEVYDRNGKLVYKSEPYQNDWEGLLSNGNTLAPGSYVYKVFSVNNRFPAQKGWLFIKY
jgi:gliding motility-associated-like protein